MSVGVVNHGVGGFGRTTVAYGEEFFDAIVAFGVDLTYVALLERGGSKRLAVLKR